MTIGTSLGNHYQDEHHYQAREFQSDFEKSIRSQYKDPGPLEDSMVRRPLEVSPDTNPFDEMGEKEMQSRTFEDDFLKIGSHSGFHQSDSVEDRRKEFFDPRTDPQGSGYDLEPGTWRQQDNETQGNETSTLEVALGGLDITKLEVKQLNARLAAAKDILTEQEKKAGITPEDSGLPGDEWGTPDLPTRKTDQQIRDEANQMKFFDTPLSSDEESKFQKWKALMAPKDTGEDYDLRGAFKAGVIPDKETGHWPDTYKKPNHPTFSDQSQYAKDAPDLVGSWSGDQYIPPVNK